MIRAILLAGLCVAVAKRMAKVSTEVNTEGACAVSWLNSLCKCNYKSGLLAVDYKCSECQDKKKWGYGCDLDCDPECGPKGCDFSGNCIEKTPEKINSKCKRNSRIADPTEETLNERGECQACERDAYGVHCEKRCADISTNCVVTAEGNCTRGGSCYQCKDGYYGKHCDKKCPDGCKSCVQADDIVPIKGDEGEFMEAGSCQDTCAKDTWGNKCDKKCPDNCKKSSIPSCDKTAGKCFKCGNDKSRNKNKPHQWWGGKCETKCADGCVDYQCLKKNGRCEAGVREGFCGENGDKRCPDGTVGGCDLQTCAPSECKEGSYPGSDAKRGAVCQQCPATCVGGTCNQDGSCNKGCQDGWWGKQCDAECPDGCDGACSLDGTCKACKDGLTGARCDKACHSTCWSCSQYSVLSFAGNKAGNCLSCPDDKPSEYNKATKTCDCIENAEFSEEAGHCVCIDPNEKDLEPYFVSRPKTCLKKCKEGLRAAYADKKFKCFTGKVYKSVVRAEALDELNQGKCAKGEYSIHVKSTASDDDEERDECIGVPFVDYILSE